MFERLGSGQTVSADHYNRLVEVLESLMRPVTSGGDYEFVYSQSQPQLLDRGKKDFPAMIGEQTGLPSNWPSAQNRYNYEFVEQVVRTDGTQYDNTTGVTGYIDTDSYDPANSSLPAIEVSGRQDVPNGEIVRMSYDPHGSYFVFKYHPADILSYTMHPTTATSMNIPGNGTYNFDLDIAYVNNPQSYKDRINMAIGICSCEANFNGGTAMCPSSGAVKCYLSIGVQNYDANSPPSGLPSDWNTQTLWAVDDTRGLAFGSAITEFIYRPGSYCPNQGVMPNHVRTQIVLRLTLVVTGGYSGVTQLYFNRNPTSLFGSASKPRLRVFHMSTEYNPSGGSTPVESAPVAEVTGLDFSTFANSQYMLAPSPIRI